MTEEPHNAATSRPIGIITAIGVSAILGCFLILSLLFSIQDYDNRIIDGSASDVDLPGHDWEEGRDCSDGE
jgi:hypothetical protein